MNSPLTCGGSHVCFKDCCPRCMKVVLRAAAMHVAVAALLHCCNRVLCTMAYAVHRAVSTCTHYKALWVQSCIGIVRRAISGCKPCADRRRGGMQRRTSTSRAAAHSPPFWHRGRRLCQQAGPPARVGHHCAADHLPAAAVPQAGRQHHSLRQSTPHLHGCGNWAIQ